MKKVVLIALLITCIILLVSCDTHQNGGADDTVDTVVKSIENDTDIPAAESDPVSTIPLESGSLENETDMGNAEIRNSAICIYMPLSEAIKGSDNIVKAKFIDVTVESNGMYHYEFEVIETVYGFVNDEKIIVDSLAADCIVMDSSISFSTYDIDYEYGKEYLLILNSLMDVFSGEYSFGFALDSLVIPLGENGNASLSAEKSLIYGEDLSKHLGAEEIADAFKNGTFEQYAVNVVKENLRVEDDYGYIAYTDMEDIFGASDYVIEIEVKYMDIESYDGSRQTCTCNVLSVYKGNLTEKEPLVVFPTGAFEIGERYIVAVRASGDSQKILIMTNRNSIYSIEQRDMIISILSQ